MFNPIAYFRRLWKRWFGKKTTPVVNRSQNFDPCNSQSVTFDRSLLENTAPTPTRRTLPADYHPELRAGESHFERSLSSPQVTRRPPVTERRRDPEPESTATLSNFLAVQGLSQNSGGIFSGGIFGGDPAPNAGYAPQEAAFGDFSKDAPDFVPDVSESFDSDLDFGS